MSDFQKAWEAELEKFNGLRRELQKAVEAKEKLDAQLNENNLVKAEFKFLEEGCAVYKLIGPVLIKQDIDEAKLTVDKRIDYISTELKRYERMIDELDEKLSQQSNALSKMQNNAPKPMQSSVAEAK